MIYILLAYMWSGSGSAGVISSTEFTSQERCEQAAQVAKAKFSGWGVNYYHVCVPK